MGACHEKKRPRDERPLLPAPGHGLLNNRHGIKTPRCEEKARRRR